jgi:hypothetical protein
MPAADAIDATLAAPSRPRLRDLHREHVGRALLRERERIDGAVQRFVGHDRNVRELREALQPGPVGRGDRLLDEAHAGVREPRAGADRFGFAPRLVHVDAHVAAIAERALDRDHVRDVVVNCVRADLQLERAMAARVEHRLGFGDVAVRVAARERPRDLDRIGRAAAEQLRQRHADAARLRIEQRGLERAFREAVALEQLAGTRHRGAGARRVHPLQQRRDTCRC